MEDQNQWIYYLRLQKDLTEEFLVLDRQFKVSGKSLVPVSIGNVLDIIKTKKSMHLMIVVRTVAEYRYFNRKVKKLLKYLVRTGKVHLYIASSFSGVNDTVIMRRDFYNFVKLPVKYSQLTSSISDTVDIKELGMHKWPGGIRSGFQLAG